MFVFSINNSIYDLHHEIDLFLLYPIVLVYSIGIPILLINVILLAYSSRYWKKARNTAERFNDANYKKATVNYVKFGVSSLVLFLEFVIVLFRGLYEVLGRIVCHRTQLDIHQGCHVAFIDLEPLYIVATLLLSCTYNMLCHFLSEVIINSNINFKILQQHGWKTFWVCIVTFAICGVGNEIVRHIGVLVAETIQIYLCWVVYRRMRIIYESLKSKCLDYTYEPKKYIYFRSQVAKFKWSSIIVGLSFEILIVLSAILEMYKSSYFLIRQYYMEEIIYTQTLSIWRAVLLAIGTIARLSVLNWAFVTTLANYYILFIYIWKALKYRRLISRPIHYKLVQIEYGRSRYRRVSY